MTSMEKRPLQSKKFVAFLISEVTWKIIILVCILNLIEADGDGGVLLHWIMLTAVIIAGFIEAGFIGGQAWLDRYVRIAKITVGAAAGVPLSSTDPVDEAHSER
jgi:hypothetical protein